MYPVKCVVADAIILEFVEKSFVRNFVKVHSITITFVCMFLSVELASSCMNKTSWVSQNLAERKPCCRSYNMECFFEMLHDITRDDTFT